MELFHRTPAERNPQTRKSPSPQPQTHSQTSNNASIVPIQAASTYKTKLNGDPSPRTTLLNTRVRAAANPPTRQPPIMLGTSLPEYVLIRLSILFFRYIPLWYALPLLYNLVTHGRDAWSWPSSRIWGLLLLLEDLYYLFLWKPYQQRLRFKAKHPPPQTREQRRALFERVLDNAPSLEGYLKGWFLGADLADIKRDNLREFLLWALFDKDEGDRLSKHPGTEVEVAEYVTEIEKRLGRTLENGRGPAKCLRLTIDDIDTTYRGLVWYLIVFCVDQFTHQVLLRWYGFEYRARSPLASDDVFPPRPQTISANLQSPVQNLSYWMKPHEAGSDTKPIVFFHGIGIGLLSYLRFLAQVHKASTRNGKGTGIMAVELLPVSFRLTTPPPGRTEFVEQMARILDFHQWREVTLVSHSYGSVLSTHMLRSPIMQHRIASVVLIDPVTVMLHLPNVAYNFTRRAPSTANEWQLWYFASTDPGVAHCLGRHFFWRENIVWRDELLDVVKDGAKQGTRSVAVCLSGRDLIVDTAAVAKYLGAGEKRVGGTGDGDADIEVALFPELDHAQVFDDRKGLQKVVDMVQRHAAA